MAKQITIDIFNFSELNDKAKKVAIENYRNSGQPDTQWMYNEAHETVKKFNELFNVNEGGNSFIEFNLNDIDDKVLELTGQRLRTYIINNFGATLYKGKYYGKLVYTDKHGAPIPKSKEHPIGARHVKRYSKAIFESSCVLTGVCYDESILQPIYDFIKQPTNNTTFADLISESFANLKKDIENEEEAMNSDDYISEEIEANDYEFIANGERF